MSKSPSQSLRTIEDPPGQFGVLRELDNIHKIMNDRLGNITDIVTLTASTTLTSKDSGNVFLIDTSAARRIVLPQPAKNLFFRFKDSTGNAAVKNITIARFASERIEGALANQVINTNFGKLALVSDGINWFIL